MGLPSDVIYATTMTLTKISLTIQLRLPHIEIHVLRYFMLFDHQETTCKDGN